MASAQGSRLTIGVEIEFLYLRPRLTSDNIDPRLPDPFFPGRWAVHQVLSRLPIRLNPVEVGLPLLAYDAWTVGWDCSVNLNRNETDALGSGYDYEAIELKSRIFSLTGDDWFSEIELVLNTLKQNINRPGSEARILVNGSCGLHVHVGHGSAGFAFPAVQRLFQLVTVFERQIDSLHTVSRIGEQDMGFCDTPSSTFAGLREEGRVRVHHPLGWADEIAALSNFRDLGHLFPDYTGHDSAYNFDNLMEWNCADPAKLTRTIEFRQHRGTLDPNEIAAWVMVVTSMVRYAEKGSVVGYDARRPTSRSPVTELCMAHAEDPGFGIAHLLAAINVSRRVRQYYSDTLRAEAATEALHKLIRNEERAGGEFMAVVTEVARAAWLDKDRSRVLRCISDRFAGGLYGAFGAKFVRAVLRGYMMDEL